VSASAPILVAGVGSVGRRHVGNLMAVGAGPVRLLRSGLGQPLPEAFGDLPVDNDLESALARRPRAVVVCNPTALHVPVGLAAARAGCHLLMEKPISHSLDGVADLARETEARGATCLVGFQFRFHPALRQVETWLADGAIGSVVSAHLEWGEYLPDWHPGEDFRSGYSARPELGGGVVLTLCHPFDTLRWLLGEVATVSAETGRLSGLGLDVEDVAQVTLRFASGAIGSVSLDYVRRPPRHALRIVGRHGQIRWNASDGAARLGRPGRDDVVCAPPPSFERNTMFVDEVRHFLDCLEGRDRPVCTLEDGTRALSIALAALESARSGRRIDV
jgi:predicted dehydrogenase